MTTTNNFLASLNPTLQIYTGTTYKGVLFAPVVARLSLI